MSERDKRDLVRFCIFFGTIMALACLIKIIPIISKAIKDLKSDIREKRIERRAKEYVDSVSLEFAYDGKTDGSSDEETYKELSDLISWVNDQEKLIKSYMGYGGSKIVEYWGDNDDTDKGKLVTEDLIENKRNSTRSELLSVTEEALEAIFNNNEGSWHNKSDQLVKAFIDENKIIKIAGYTDGERVYFSNFGISRKGIDSEDLILLLDKTFPDLFITMIRNELSDLSKYTGYGSESSFTQNNHYDKFICVKNLAAALQCWNKDYNSKQSISAAYNQIYNQVVSAWNSKHKNNNTSNWPHNSSSNNNSSYYYYYDDDIYDAKDYDDGDDFADEYEDEFDDWDDAYDYWEENH